MTGSEQPHRIEEGDERDARFALGAEALISLAERAANGDPIAIEALDLSLSIIERSNNDLRALIERQQTELDAALEDIHRRLSELP